jgi:Adenylate cyclase, family 3 (some proteins contain HAMP domain)
MALRDDLISEVGSIFGDAWDTRNGSVVPESEDLGLGNEAITLDATVLYADLAASTELVDRFKAHFAAEVYKAFLHCAAKIIREQGGTITAYDGDRIMAVYIGNRKNTTAAKTALKLNYAAKQIINPAIAAQYPKTSYAVKHVVGVDTSALFVARTGVRGANDLVWVGRAANYAAKLTELDPSYASNITDSVYNAMLDEAKLSHKGEPMWTKFSWMQMNKMTIYRSTWTWTV